MEIFKRHKSGVLNQNDANTSTVPKPTNGKPVNDADCKQFGFVNVSFMLFFWIGYHGHTYAHASVF